MSHKIVLYIDDEEVLCEIFQELYTTEYCQVQTFTDPHAALAFLNKNHVDCIFVDYRMPQMNGIEFSRAVKQEIPIYLFTGELELEVDQMEPQITELFYKPLDEIKIKKILMTVK